MTLPRLLFGLLLAALPLAPAVGKDPDQPADLFDFWVGDWNAKWKNTDGTEGRGRNTITKILDGKVLEENFEAEGTPKAPGLKAPGRSRGFATAPPTLTVRGPNRALVRKRSAASLCRRAPARTSSASQWPSARASWASRARSM